MPGKERQELVEILNVGDRWYELGAKYMNYSTVDLDKFAKEQYKPGGNPAEMLLSHWGSKNHTVLQLFKKLKKMEHYQAMDVIKGLVPKEYHNLINYNVSSFGAGEQSRNSRPFQQVVLPPVKYTQAGAANGPNIDISMEKAMNLKKMPIAAGTSSENQGLAVEYWDATKGSGNLLQPGENPRVRRQSSNSSTATAGGASSIYDFIDGAAGSFVSTSEKNMLRQISFEEVKKCCNDFNKKLGSGGFGDVYYGKLDCTEVAVKKIKRELCAFVKNDPNYVEALSKWIATFTKELVAMHTYTHKNIVRLMCVSFSEDLSTEPCLVYEFMSNGSVFDHLYKRGRGGRPRMTWQERLNIAVGTARGLVYLHKNEVVHGDIKSGNILLDENMVPKIGDFGLARKGPETDLFSYVTVSRIVGTPSYLPEDFKRSAHLTYAVDTYAYGMLLFELVTGKPPNWESPKKEKLNSFIRDVTEISDWVDKSIEGHPLAFQLFGFAKECTHANFRKRTKIQFVFEALEKIQKGEREALVLQKMRDDQNEQLEHQKAVKMMRQMAIVGNKSTVPIGDCGIPDLPLEPPKILLETQDDDVEAEDVAMVEDSDIVAGRPDQQADQYQINQPAVLNNAVEAKKSEEASVDLIYDDTTEDFTRDRTEDFTQD